MLEQLTKLVNDNAVDAIVNNPAIPNSRNSEAISETAITILNSLKTQSASGNLNKLISFFQSGDPQIATAITTQVTNLLSQKFGLTGRQAAGAAMSIVPKVLINLKNKAKDPNDKSFDLNEVFSVLTNGQTSRLDMNNVLKNFAGGNLNGENLRVLSGSKKDEPVSVFNKVRGFFSY